MKHAAPAGPRLSLIGHTSLWTIGFTLFVWVAARHVVFSGEFGPIAPFHSTDRYLAATIHSRAGSERLLEVFTTLPAREPVAVMYREDEQVDTSIAFTVLYFAWPRKVQRFPLRRDNLSSQMQALAEAPVSAAFFCGVEPPSGIEPIFRVGKGLSLSPRNTSPPREP